MVQIQAPSSSLSSLPSSTLRRRKVIQHRMPPPGAVLLSAIVLWVSCYLKFQQQHSARHQHQHQEQEQYPHYHHIHHQKQKQMQTQTQTHRTVVTGFQQQEQHGATTSTGTGIGIGSNSIINSDWCQSQHCLDRLEALQSKLQLEERIYQEQFEIEKVRSLNNTYYYQQYTRDAIIHSRRKQIHEDSSDNEYHFPPKPEWRGASPELNVIGNLKTGTSHLYNIFATHKQVTTIEGEEKEHCPSDHYGKKNTDADTYEYALYSWHKQYFDHRVPGKLQVNGCISMDELERRIAYNPPQKSAKFFVLLRDPADWAWAAYNFWCHESWEDYERDDNWVDESLHYRSPEVFHEIILSGGKLKPFEFLQEFKENSIRLLRKTRALVGKDNLIVLKNEDLVPSRIHESGLLQRLVNVTGLSMEGFDESILKSRSNCNGNKGYDEKCLDSDRSKSTRKGTSNVVGKAVGYPVTHHRPMFESTRRFIYLQWHKECKIWAEEFGVEYSECLGSIDD